MQLEQIIMSKPSAPKLGMRKALIVDQHWIVRSGLKHLIREIVLGTSFVEADTAEAACQLLKMHSDIDLILMDIMIDGLTPFESLQLVREAAGDIPIIVISDLARTEDILHTIELGASGFLPKTATEDEAARALDAIRHGEVYITKSTFAAKPLAGSGQTGAGFLSNLNLNAVVDLTNRQKEVLRQLAEGLSNREIANALELSEHTVKIHVAAILKVLKVHNRTQAALVGRRFDAKAL